MNAKPRSNSNVEETKRDVTKPTGKGKGNKYRKNGRGNSRPFDKAKEYHKDPHNDVSWYNKNPQLVKDTASISMHSAVGYPFTLNHNGEGSGTYVGNVPGIMSLFTMPCVGASAGSASMNSAVNVAMRDIYTNIRSRNSGSKVYDPADLMMYFLTMDSLYTYHAWLVRLYGILNIFDPENRYMPDNLVSAQRVNVGSLRSNMANFRSYINNFASRLNSMCVPNILPYFMRHSWMYSNVYRDENVSKCQFYMYIPAFLNLFEVDQETGAGRLVPYPICAQYTTSNGIEPRSETLNLTALTTLGETLISAIQKIEDMSVISGDVLKMYGDQLVRVPYIDDTYTVIPTFSEEVLGQIHNTEFVGIRPLKVTPEATVQGLDSLITYQITSVGGGEITFLPYFKNARHLAFDKIVDFWKQNVTADDMMVATRNKVVGKIIIDVDSSEPITQIESCGSELVFFASLTTRNASSAIATQYLYTSDSSSGLGYYMECFNEYPNALIFPANVTSLQPEGIIGELDNFAVVSTNTMANMHNTALMSMFDVPSVK